LSLSSKRSESRSRAGGKKKPARTIGPKARLQVVRKDVVRGPRSELNEITMKKSDAKIVEKLDVRKKSDAKVVEKLEVKKKSDARIAEKLDVRKKSDAKIIEKIGEARIAMTNDPLSDAKIIEKIGEARIAMTNDPLKTSAAVNYCQ
jgi:alpha-L-fucosidase